MSKRQRKKPVTVAKKETPVRMPERVVPEPVVSRVTLSQPVVPAAVADAVPDYKLVYIRQDLTRIAWISLGTLAAYVLLFVLNQQFQWF